MAAAGVTVDQPIIPTSIELSQNQSELQDPKAHPVRVSSLLIQLKTIVNVICKHRLYWNIWTHP
jgi:hypothetical protein